MTAGPDTTPLTLAPRARSGWFERDGVRLHYLDRPTVGEEAGVAVLLHGHYSTAHSFDALMAALPEWRCVALDQRGHGDSERADSFTRADYLDDLDALWWHLGLDSAVLVGHSLGGCNAYAYAARRPERVRGQVVIDIGAEIDGDATISRFWGGDFPTRSALEEALGERLSSQLADAVRVTTRGWRMSFLPEAMMASQSELNGDHWHEWLGSDCPTLLVNGQGSDVLSPRHAAEMASRRPATRLVQLPGGHLPHLEGPLPFAAEVRDFLQALPR
ncbi:alpha/beta fold hydrolase [Actinomycetota bacterium]